MNFFKFKLPLTILVLVVLLALPAGLVAEVPRLTILHTNDHHGHLAPFTYNQSPETGGLAAQYAAVNIVRQEVEKSGGHVLILSAGDVNSGMPDSDLLNAEPDFKAMNLIGYDAMALGNHEFDKPREVLQQQKAWAQFPFLAANILLKDTGKPLFGDYIIKQLAGLKVAIIGFTTPETPKITLPGRTSDLIFVDPAQAAKEILAQVRDKVDIVIALTHLGYYPELKINRLHKGDGYLARNAPGIDVIVGGHTHSAFKKAKRIGNTLVVQAGEFGVYLGRLDLKYDDQLRKIVSHKSQLIPINLKAHIEYKGEQFFMSTGPAFVPHLRVTKLLAPYLEKSNAMLSEPVGEAMIPLVGDRVKVRSGETNLGNLITDVMRETGGAEVALQNAGGIRSGIAQGRISYRDILAVLPFGDTLITMELTGAQLLEVLQHAARQPPGSGGWLHVSGLTWGIQGGMPANVMIGGKPLDQKRVYRVATNNFLAAGGDGYSVLQSGAKKYDTGFLVADMVRQYISRKKQVAPQVEGRLKVGP